MDMWPQLVIMGEAIDGDSKDSTIVAEHRYKNYVQNIRGKAALPDVQTGAERRGNDMRNGKCKCPLKQQRWERR